MVKEEFHADTLADYVVPVPAGNDPDQTPYLDVLPCSVRIDDFEKNRNKGRDAFRSNEEFQTALRKRTRSLRRWLQAGYDYTIIDSPPSLPIQNQMLLKVADAYVMPTVPDKLSVRGSYYLTERLRRMNFKLPGLGTIWSLYREQNAIHRDMLRLAEYEKDRTFAWMPSPFETIIPNAQAVARAMESSADSLNAKYTSRFANLYRDLVHEITTRCQARLSTPSTQPALAAAT